MRLVVSEDCSYHWFTTIPLVAFIYSVARMGRSEKKEDDPVAEDHKSSKRKSKKKSSKKEATGEPNVSKSKEKSKDKKPKKKSKSEEVDEEWDPLKGGRRGVAEKTKDENSAEDDYHKSKKSSKRKTSKKSETKESKSKKKKRASRTKEDSESEAEKPSTERDDTANENIEPGDEHHDSEPVSEAALSMKEVVEKEEESSESLEARNEIVTVSEDIPIETVEESTDTSDKPGKDSSEAANDDDIQMEQVEQSEDNSSEQFKEDGDIKAVRDGEEDIPSEQVEASEEMSCEEVKHDCSRAASEGDVPSVKGDKDNETASEFESTDSVLINDEGTTTLVAEQTEVNVHVPEAPQPDGENNEVDGTDKSLSQEIEEIEDHERESDEIESESKNNVPVNADEILDVESDDDGTNSMATEQENSHSTNSPEESAVAEPDDAVVPEDISASSQEMPFEEGENEGSTSSNLLESADDQPAFTEHSDDVDNEDAVEKSKLSIDDFAVAMNVLAFLKVHKFQCVKAFECEVIERNGKVDKKAIRKTVKALKKRILEESRATEPLDKEADVPPRSESPVLHLEENDSPSESSEETTPSASSSSVEQETSETEQYDKDPEEKVAPITPKKNPSRRVSFCDDVSRDEFDGFSPQKKSELFYSKIEIDEMKAADQAEKDEKKAVDRAKKKVEEEKAEELREEDIRRIHKQQLAEQREKLKNRSEEREEEWKKQQEQAEAMERMMQEALSGAFSARLGH